MDNYEKTVCIILLALSGAIVLLPFSEAMQDLFDEGGED